MLHMWNYKGTEVLFTKTGDQFASGDSTAICNTDKGISAQHMTCNVHLYNPPENYNKGWDDDKRCNVCIYAQRDATCPVGHYAESTAAVTNGSNTGVTYGAPGCSVCAPGSWLTCKSGTSTAESCRYQVRRTYLQGDSMDSFGIPRNVFWKDEDIPKWLNNLRLNDADINTVITATNVYDLVGQCYPCRYAANVAHYGNFANVAVDSLKSGKLPFKCIGGASPPVDCPDFQVAVMDARGWASVCQCDDGYYSNFTGGLCERCPAGSYCAIDMKNSPYWTQKLPCPKYYYSLAGASTCTKCNTDSASCCPSGVNDCGLVRTACLTDFQDRDSRCIDCTSCRELDPQGEAPCFGIYNAVGVGTGN